MQKHNPCILCDGFTFRIIHQRDKWQYLCCKNCGLVSLHPRPDSRELMEKYRDYLPVQLDEIDKWKRMIQPVNKISADLIETRTNKGKGKLLDIGCGYGFFLKEMNFRGWHVSGIEISQTGRRFARQLIDTTVYSEPLENLSLPKNAFDVVTLFYVIEHALNPLNLLMEVNRILKPNGLVLLRWPHTTPIVTILGPLSKKLDLYHTPFHLHDFSPKTIARLLNKAGFTSVETIIAGHTLPSDRLSRWASIIFGQTGKILFSLSNGKILFPGISKISLALK